MNQEPNEASKTNKKKGFVASVLTLGAAKIWFVLAGSVLSFGLPLALGSVELFGLLSVAQAAVAIVSNTVVASTLQWSSFRVARAAHPFDEYKTIMAKQRRFALLLAMTFLVVGGALAFGPLHDSRLLSLFALGAIVEGSYLLYSTSIGALNGLERFGDQARFDAGFATIRVGLMLGLAFVFRDPNGAMLGFAIAAVLVSIFAHRLLLRHANDWQHHPSETSETRMRATSFAAFLGYQLLMNALLQGDVLLLKGRVASSMNAAGLSALQAADVASFEAGLYRAAQSYAFLPYQLLVAVSLALFPRIAKARDNASNAQVRNEISNAHNFAAAFAFAIAAAFSGTAEGVVGLLHSASYASSSESLFYLAPTLAFFSLASISSTVLLGVGQATAAIRSAAIGVFLVLLLSLKVETRVQMAMVSLLGTFAFALCAGLAVLKYLQDQVLVIQRSSEENRWYLRFSRLVRPLLKPSLVHAIAFAVCSCGASFLFSGFASSNGLLRKLLTVGVCGASVLTYLLILLAFGVLPLSFLRKPSSANS